MKTYDRSRALSLLRAGAANPTVFTSTAATPPAYTLTLSGVSSYDPDGSPGFTAAPVSAYSWTTTGPSGTVGGGCTTGKIGPPVAQVFDLSCTLPAVYGTYTINLTVFDAETIIDQATYEAPTRPARGVEHVFVNGCHVVDGDRYDASARAGRVLRG